MPEVLALVNSAAQLCQLLCIFSLPSREKGAPVARSLAQPATAAKGRRKGRGPSLPRSFSDQNRKPFSEPLQKTILQVTGSAGPWFLHWPPLDAKAAWECFWHFSCCHGSRRGARWARRKTAATPRRKGPRRWRGGEEESGILGACQRKRRRALGVKSGPYVGAQSRTPGCVLDVRNAPPDSPTRHRAGSGVHLDLRSKPPQSLFPLASFHLKEPP